MTEVDVTPRLAVAPTIDLDADGARAGWLRTPHSDDDSAWGAVMTPVFVVKNGDGPTALLTAGSHGDEYEGPIALHDLAAGLTPEAVRGRVIVIPGLNQPALKAGRRLSPLDGGNMNRAFPGRPDGGPTAKMADFVTRALLPRVDAVLDLHSGGRTLDFSPCAVAHRLQDPAQEAACVAAARAFGAPMSVALKEIDAAGMLDTTVEAAGKIFVSTELGGGGGTTAARVAIAKLGVRRWLAHLGVLRDAPTPSVDESPLYETPDDDCYVLSRSEGLLEPLVDLGDHVAAGDAVARVWPLDRVGAAPEVYTASRAGVVFGKRHGCAVRLGDPIAVLAVPV